MTRTTGTTTILDAFRARTEEMPDKLLFAFLDVDGRTIESFTYAQFFERTTDIAAHIARTCRLSPGERVLLAYPPGVEMMCAFFACVRLGLIPVPVYPPTSHGFAAARYKMQFIARDCGAAAVLTCRSYYWSMKVSELKSRFSSAPRDSGAALKKLHWIISNDAERTGMASIPQAHSPVLFLQYTSGSTSDPKGVMVTHDNIVDNCAAVVDHLPIGVSWLPQYHDMGLIGYYLFFALKGGTTYGFSPLDFIKRPSLWFETITKVRATASSAPTFAFEYCLRPEKLPPELFAALDLSSLRFLMIAAEPVRANVYRRFLEKFAPYGLDERAFFAAYGLAEHTLAVTNYGRTSRVFDRESLAQHIACAAPANAPEAETTTLMSCGRPLGATEVNIVDVAASAAADNSAVGPASAAAGNNAAAAGSRDATRVGEIWLRGPSKCLGYWERPALTAATFNARLPRMTTGDAPRSSVPIGDAGWLRTGDLGFVLDGELFVCGRCKDMIVVRGLNYYPQDIEALIEQDARVRRGSVAAFAIERNGERARVVVAAEVKNAKALPDARDLQTRLVSGLGLGADTFAFVAPRTIDKTSSGKIARHAVKRRFEDATLALLRRVDAPFSAERAAGTRAKTAHTPVVERDPGTDAYAPLLRSYGLSGTETTTLADVGLDSIRVVELSHDLQHLLRARGHADLARVADLRALQNIAVCELFDLLAQLEAATPIARLRFKSTFEHIARAHCDEDNARMLRDARLGADVAAQVRTAARVVACDGGRDVGRVEHDVARDGEGGGAVLLTGATGFFGPFLLASLLRRSRDDIYVLVRANDEQSALKRVADGLASTCASANAGLPPQWERRVRPICGDLARPRLGLSASAWSALADSTQSIFHNGALVNYLWDYTALRDANVAGTSEVIRLAATGRRKVLNHISTTFIFGWSVKETLLESDMNATMDHLDFGYSQSKWVAEQLVLDAMKHGLDARVFRPALVSPSTDGCGTNFDIAIRLLSFMLKHGIGTTASNQVSFTPADVAADNIAAIAVAGAADTLGLTFHVTRDEYASMSDVTGILGGLTSRAFACFALADFVPEVIGRCKKGDVLFPLLEFLVRSTPNIAKMEFKRYDNRNFRRARAACGGRTDPPLEEVVAGMLTFIRRHNLVDAVDAVGGAGGVDRDADGVREAMGAPPGVALEEPR